MKPMFSETNVLITVMTYPHPSHRHQELVCTAGITEAGDWVRLYPIDYRYRPNHQQFKKYQWIRLGLAPRGFGNDERKESRQPDLESIQILGEPLSTDKSWEARRAIIDRLPHHTRIGLGSLYDTDRTSLGIVAPSEILDLTIEPAERDWKPEWQAVLSQFNLFYGQPKALAKLPYKFSYVFRCSDTGVRPHSAMIEDWELGVLFLKEKERLGSEEAAAQSVKKKYLDEICAAGRETRFFMGTVFPYNTWVVIGLYWPPRIQQARLF
ncbi:hypothetical protein ACPOL_6214 [Acidisarcina polymorpha]|uniref:Uncharacterized protein n=2 Tax=Acidisarcina polymorpha TaxID=2211140 RepID=A0A2Z5G905_9BACT|nr:hypothetical protein ACPOL_6214 [Acidisarcina polymorpha]